MEKGQKVKVRLPDSRVVEAEYICKSSIMDKTHQVKFEGNFYWAANYRPENIFPMFARFVWSQECKI